jgi:SAM-dependent methyltransferase
METSKTATAVDPFAQFKAQQREGWASFIPLELMTTPPAAKLINFIDVRKGEKVLDVACGTGVTSVTAANRGAQVTGLDLTPALLERARYNAQLAGVQIEFLEGDAEHLPFPDASFDVVISQFGHMFAPQAAVTIAEMLRVLKPGGRIAFSTWPPEGFTGRMFSLMGEYLPAPPAGFSPPVQWGNPDIIRERLGSAVDQLTFDRNTMFTPGLSPRHIVGKYEEQAAPVKKAVEILKDNPAKLAELRARLQKLVEIYFQDNQIRQDFLMTRAIKK